MTTHTISAATVDTADRRPWTVEIVFDTLADPTERFTVLWGRDAAWGRDVFEVEGSETFFSIDAAIARRDRKVAELENTAKIERFIRAGRADHRSDRSVMFLNSYVPRTGGIVRMRLNASVGMSTEEYLQAFHGEAL